MANKTITIKPNKQNLRTLKYMKELKDLQKEITILKFKNEELQKQLNLCDVSHLLIAWEEYKLANMYESDYINVEKMLMERFVAIYCG